MQIDKSMQRRFVVSIIVGLVVYLALAVFGDLRSVAASLRAFNLWTLPVILALASLNYVLRFLRWSYFLRLLDISLPLKTSVTVFMSGLAMSISPGKLGELLKAYLLKRMSGIAVRRSVPVIFAERFTDLLSVVALAAAGAFGFQHGRVLVIFGAAITLGPLLVVMNRRLTLTLIDRVISKLPLIRRKASSLHELYDHAYNLLLPAPLAVATALGLASWSCECLGLYVTIHALGATIDLWHAVFIYTFSTFVGAVTFLPGGLGTTEGSLTGLLMLRQIPRDVASAATIIIRLATLWFAVALGLLWLAPNRAALIPDRKELEAAADPDD